MIKARFVFAAALAVTASMGLSGSYPANAQSVTEARSVLEDIERWLPGSFDNESQILVEATLGAGADGIHEWYHIEISKIANGDNGSLRFRSMMKDRANPSAPIEHAVFAFRVDEEMGLVRMDRYRVPLEDVDNGRLRDRAIKTDKELLDVQCPVFWQPGPGYVYAAMQGVWCEMSLGEFGGGGTIIVRGDYHLTVDEFWMLSATRDSETNVLTRGRADDIPLRLKKVK